jgi:hypothetical protein
MDRKFKKIFGEQKKEYMESI